MPFNIDDPSFLDVGAVEKELAGVPEICDSCRRCHRLCTPFDFMLERVDAHEGDLSKLEAKDYWRVVDLCWQCKLCFNPGPYTPPHRWDIDFPRLMLRAKAARAARDGVSLQDRALGNPDAVGSLGGFTAPLSNWANQLGASRLVLEKTL